MDEVGKKLKSARIEKGYTLDDLQQITKIQKRYLIAIEDGNFDQLPGDFYVRAFIKQYAETVGLDSHELLDEFSDTIPETQPQDYVENSIENKKRTLHDETNSFGYWLRNNLGKIIIGVVIVIVVASLYFFAVRAANQRKTQIPDESSALTSSTKSKQSSKKASSESAAKSSSKAKESSRSSESSAKKDELKVTENGTNAFTVTGLETTADNKLTLGASGSSAWVQVTFPSDTSSNWQSVLTDGGTHELTIPAGTTTFTLQSGNTPSTTLKINDTTVSLPTGTSVVQTFTFTVQATSDDSSSSSVTE